MVGAGTLLGVLLLAFSQGEPWAYADYPYLPGSPLQPVGRPREGATTPKALPDMIPAAPPMEPAPRNSTSPPPPFAPEAPKPLTCEDVCSSQSLKAVFQLDRGRIGSESRVEVDNGESFEMRAYSEQCPHTEGKEVSVTSESLPDGCLLVFSIPAARAAWTGAKTRTTLRCSAGKVGMSGFHCNESNSPSSSFTNDLLSRD